MFSQKDGKIVKNLTKKNLKKNKIFLKKVLTNAIVCGIIVTERKKEVNKNDENNNCNA